MNLKIWVLFVIPWIVEMWVRRKSYKAVFLIAESILAVLLGGYLFFIEEGWSDVLAFIIWIWVDFILCVIYMICFFRYFWKKKRGTLFVVPVLIFLEMASVAVIYQEKPVLIVALLYSICFFLRIYMEKKAG